MKNLLPLFILIFAISVSAQVRKPVKPTPKPVPSPAVEDKLPTQKVVIEKTNGDKITGLFVGGNSNSITVNLEGSKITIKLSDISTLRFGEQSTTQNTSAASNLSVEAALIYRSGEVVPVARTTFYLLDEDVVLILKDAGIQTTDNTYPTYAEGIISDIGFSARYGSLPKYQEFSAKMAAAIKPHIKYTFQTDFSGKATLTDVPAGNYFLFGIGSTRKSGVVWNLQIDTTTTKSLTLDANNAAFAY